jgi:hypothetical protein
MELRVTLTILPRNIQRLLRVLSLFFSALSNQILTRAVTMRAINSVDNAMPSSKHGVKSKDRSWGTSMLSNSSKGVLRDTYC